MQSLLRINLSYRYGTQKEKNYDQKDSSVSISHIGMEPNRAFRTHRGEWSINLSYRYGTGDVEVNVRDLDLKYQSLI